jgi:DNA-directed RNA polymerase specialized sigma24 family protein
MWAVWLYYYLGYDIEETAGLLAMSVRSVKRYLRKDVRTGELMAKKTGVAFHCK